MSPSSSRLSPQVRNELRDLLELKLLPGQPRTLDAIEAATVQLVRELAPQLMEDLIQGVDCDLKKKHRPSAAVSPPNTKG